MNTQLKHLPSGKTFGNRKAAKQDLGHYAYDRALKKGEIVFFTTYLPSDIL